MYDLAIIIPHLNDLARLRRCLDHLHGQIDYGVEVIVVDNGSDADQLLPLWRYPWVKVLGQQIKGAGPARNVGVLGSSARRLAFLDSDCIPSADWVDRVRDLDVDGSVIGGRVETFDEGHWHNSGAQLFERLFAFDNRRYVTKLGFSVTANLVTTRAIFDQVGPFRAELAEDADWCRRAGAMGYAMRYEPELLVSHPTRADWGALKTKWQRLMREGFAPHQGKAAGRLFWIGRAILTAASILRDTPKVLLSRKVYGLRDRAKCLSMLIRLRLARSVWMGRQALTGRA